MTEEEKELEESIALAEKYYAESGKSKVKDIYDEDDEQDDEQDEAYEPYVLKHSEARSQKQSKRSKQVWKLLLIAAVVIVIAAGAYLVRYVLSHKRSQDKIEDLRNNNRIEDTTDQADNSETDVHPAASVDIPVDFDQLQQENADAYAWIYVPNTVIDYPILQHPTDNTFYLRRDITKTDSMDGSIFTEDYNAKDFHDFHTVIYGHNMSNGSMFRDLHKFEDREFADANRYFYIYTPDAIRTYQIFAIYSRDDRHLLYSLDFSDETTRRNYIDSILEQQDLIDGFVYEDVDVTVDNNIITLSTCNEYSDQRFLVQGVLVSEEK